MMLICVFVKDGLLFEFEGVLGHFRFCIKFLFLFFFFFFFGLSELVLIFEEV